MQEGGKRTTGRLRCGPELGLVRALAARTCGASASTLNSLAKPVLSSSMLRVPSPSVSSVLNTCRTRPGGMPWLAAVWGVASATLSPANAAAATSVMVPVCAGKRRQPRSPRNVPRSVQRSLGENFRTERPEMESQRWRLHLCPRCGAILSQPGAGSQSARTTQVCLFLSRFAQQLDETVLWSKSLRTIPGVWIRAWWGLHRREIRVAHVKKRPIFSVSYLIFKFRVELVT